MKETVKYVANDGALFDTHAECAAYEKKCADKVRNGGWKEVTEVTHLTFEKPDFNKVLMFLVRDVRDADAVEVWCDEREIIFPGVHEYPTIFAIDCRDRTHEPIDVEELNKCRTPGVLETLETYIGRTAFELTISAGELFHTNDE